MKKKLGLLLLSLVFCGGCLYANDTIGWTWKAALVDRTKVFCFTGTEGGDFVLHWGDGESTYLRATGNMDSVTHTYATPGSYNALLCGISNPVQPAAERSKAESGEARILKVQCATQNITALDLSKNENLRYLHCGYNQLTNLDLKQAVNLKWLYCQYNSLEKLDVTKNTDLVDLYCAGNQLTELEVSRNTELEALYCAHNRLTALDVSRNVNITYIDCSNNDLKKLNTSNNLKLSTLECNNTAVGTLDVTKNTALIALSCENNRLTDLDLSKNSMLRRLQCSKNSLQSLKMPEFKYDTLWLVTIDSNQLSLADIAGIEEALEGKYGYRCLSPQIKTSNVTLSKYLDLSAEMDLSSSPTEYSVYLLSEQGETDQYTEKSGRFTFKKTGSYCIRLHNGDFVENAYWHLFDIDESRTITNYTDSLPPVYVYYRINVTNSGDGDEPEDPDSPDNPDNPDEPEDPTANETGESLQPKVFAQDRTIYVTDATGQVEVYSVLGQRFYKGTNYAIPVNTAGVYVVFVNGRSYKLIVR